MVKKWLCCIGCLAAIAVVGAAGTPPSMGSEYILRVTSSVPGEEVQFEGAFLFNDADASLEVVRRSTPFEARSSGQVGVGVFRKVEGEAQIVVEVVTIRNGKMSASHKAKDDGVIFNQDLNSSDMTFMRTFGWGGSSEPVQLKQP